MDFLSQQNRAVAGELDPAETRILAKDRVTVVIGGGDTGSDCVGTAIRQGAKAVHQWEILPQPPAECNPQTPWPGWPRILRTSTSQAEGCTRRWGVKTTRLRGRGVRVSSLHGVEVEWVETRKGYTMKDVPGTEFQLDADLVLLAMGFVHVAHRGLVEELALEKDERGNVRVDENCMTSHEGVFGAGDATQGASLVVRAIDAGRKAAAGIDQWLRRQT